MTHKIVRENCQNLVVKHSFPLYNKSGSNKSVNKLSLSCFH